MKDEILEEIMKECKNDNIVLSAVKNICSYYKKDNICKYMEEKEAKFKRNF